MSDTQTHYIQVGDVPDTPATTTVYVPPCAECAKHAAMMRNLREWLRSIVADDETGYSDALVVLAWIDAWEGKR